MITRRRFIQSSFGAFAAAAAARRALAAEQPIGVQLYTVRTLTKDNLPGLLGEIRKIGYDEVETY